MYIILDDIKRLVIGVNIMIITILNDILYSYFSFSQIKSFGTVGRNRYLATTTSEIFTNLTFNYPIQKSPYKIKN